MKNPARSLTLWINFGFLLAAKFYPKLSQGVCANPQLSIELVVMANTLLRLKTSKSIGVTRWGGIALVIALSVFILAGCSSVTPQPMDPAKYYRKDIAVTYQGKVYDGVAVLPKASFYELFLKPKADMDLLIVRSCHRDFVAEKASGGGLFNKKDYKYYYEPVQWIEDQGVCPVKIDALESGSNEYSGAFVDFQSAAYALPYRLYCNGIHGNVSGVGICQARAGTTQVIAFDEPIRFAPQPEHCSAPVLRDGHYEITAAVGECLYTFDTKSGVTGRLTMLGYDGLVLRSQD